MRAFQSIQNIKEEQVSGTELGVLNPKSLFFPDLDAHITKYLCHVPKSLNIVFTFKMKHEKKHLKKHFIFNRTYWVHSLRHERCNNLAFLK